MGEGDYGFLPCANFFFAPNQNKLFSLPGNGTSRFPPPLCINPYSANFENKLFIFLQFAEQTIFSLLFPEQFKNKQTNKLTSPVSSGRPLRLRLVAYCIGRSDFMHFIVELLQYVDVLDHFSLS